MSSFDIAEELAVEETLRVGQVIEVSGRIVKVQVDGQKNSTHFTYRGSVIRGVGVGTYLRMLRGPIEIVGRVAGEFITENRDPQAGTGIGRDLRRVLSIEVIGKFDLAGHFVGGAAELPLISNVAYLLPPADAEALFAFVGSDDDAIDLGSLVENEDERLIVSLDRLLASHIGIFGNTGSGKSNTLASILAEVARRYRNSDEFRGHARFLVLDFNGEYVATDARTPIVDDPSLKSDTELGDLNAPQNRVNLPLSALDDAEFWAVLLEATPKTQTPLIRRAIRTRKWLEALSSEPQMRQAVLDLLLEMTRDYNASIERNSPMALLESLQSAFQFVIDPSEFDPFLEFLRSDLVLNTTTQGFYLNTNGQPVWANTPAFETQLRTGLDAVLFPVDALTAVQGFQIRLVMQYHLEIARGYANRDYLAPMMKRLETRIPDIDTVLEFTDDSIDATPFTIVSLKQLSSEMQRVVSVLLVKYAYDRQKTVGKDSGDYLAVVIDEAHNVLSTQSGNESDQWRDYRLSVFENLIKEGRKFGAFVFVSSQRPFDISPTIMSQLQNFFLHRLVNVRDIDAIERLVPYLDRVSFEQIPLLATGTCVVTGLMVERPLVTSIELLPVNLRPISETMRPTRAWGTAS
ncbi:MAG TPA: ATP-binding protein [Galbitalea sp.]|nr:ATP-binding protein [Galbitalea sp.]